MIDTKEALEKAVQHWATESIISVDTESSAFHTYTAELCLLQISTAEGRNYLIDVPAIRDLSPLDSIFSNPKIMKIYHAAHGDIMLLHNLLGLHTVKIFDTFLASRYLRRTEHSLVAIIKDFLGIHLSKKEQRSDWRRRPLTYSQCRYAYSDTVYLHRIYELMKKELLVEPELWESLGDDLMELDSLSAISPSLPAISSTSQDMPTVSVPRFPKEFLNLSGEDASIGKKIFYLVDAYAKQQNMARFRIMNNRDILLLSRQWKQYKAYPQTNFSRKARNSIQKRLFDYIQKNYDVFSPPEISFQSRASKGSHRNRSSAFSSQQKEMLSRLKGWRSQIAQKMKLQPDLIMSTKMLTNLAELQPKDLENLQVLGKLGPYRLKSYGPAILKILAK